MDRRQFLATGAASAGAAVAATAGVGRATTASSTTLPHLSMATADGTRLRVRDWGIGRPVVFAAAWALNADFWVYQFADLLQQGVRCVAFDRRGHGRSDDPGRGYDLDTLSDDLATIIETLDLNDITLVGHSMGAGEVVRYITRHGTRRVARIVLACAITPGLMKSDANPVGMPPELFEAARERMAADFPRWVAENEAPFWTPDTSPERKVWGRMLMVETSLPAALACHRTMLATDFRSELSSLDIPTTVIHGDKDASAPLPLTAVPTARLVRGARLIVYEGAPHGLPVTHRARFSRDLLTA